MIRVICVAYERLIPLRILIDCFMVQTSNNWILDIIYDGKPPDDIVRLIESYNTDSYRKGFLNFTWSETRNQCFGHPNRRMMLNSMKFNAGDFILMTNDDNYYCPVFVDKITKEIEPDTGIVYCDTVHSHFDYTLHKSALIEYGIDMGAFIVRQDVAKAVGFKHNGHTADGKYAQECSALCDTMGLKTKHIERPIFIHN